MLALSCSSQRLGYLLKKYVAKQIAIVNLSTRVAISDAMCTCSGLILSLRLYLSFLSLLDYIGYMYLLTDSYRIYVMNMC